LPSCCQPRKLRGRVVVAKRIREEFGRESPREREPLLQKWAYAGIYETGQRRAASVFPGMLIFVPWCTSTRRRAKHYSHPRHISRDRDASRPPQERMGGDRWLYIVWRETYSRSISGHGWRGGVIESERAAQVDLIGRSTKPKRENGKETTKREWTRTAR